MLEQSPRFTLSDAERLARDHFGVAGRASVLPSERDQNFLITPDAGLPIVLKIANAAEDPTILDAQRAVIEHLAKSMTITPRASTHYEWDQQSVAGSLPASRLGQITSIYYTIAWYDYYLKHKASGLRRLTARTYDGSADKHSIGGGTFSLSRALAAPADPTAGNVPYTIKGMCVANTMSIYYASAYWLDHGERQSANLRNRGC